MPFSKKAFCLEGGLCEGGVSSRDIIILNAS